MRVLRWLLAAGLVWTLPLSSGAQARWTLVENLRIGSEDEGPYLFSDIRGTAVGERGSIFVLDYKAQEIRVFDAQGKFIKRAARRGAGPGEIRNANGLLGAPDGRIWVNDPNNARFSVFTPSGDFATQYAAVRWGFQYMWNATFDRTGLLHQYFPVRAPNATSSTEMIQRVRENGTVMDTIPLASCALRGATTEGASFAGRSAQRSFYMAVPFLPRPVMAWDPRGFTWCSSRDRYEVSQLRLVGGDTVLRITAPTQPVPVKEAERQAAIEPIRKAYREIGQPEPDYNRIPRVKPAIDQIDVDNTGRLWVRRTTTDTTRTTFDIWDDRGRQLATVVAPWKVGSHYRPLIRGDTMYTVIVDENDVPVVVRAVIRR